MTISVLKAVTLTSKKLRSNIEGTPKTIDGKVYSDTSTKCRTMLLPIFSNYSTRTLTSGVKPDVATNLPQGEILAVYVVIWHVSTRVRTSPRMS